MRKIKLWLSIGFGEVLLACETLARTPQPREIMHPVSTPSQYVTPTITTIPFTKSQPLSTRGPTPILKTSATPSHTHIYTPSSATLILLPHSSLGLTPTLPAVTPSAVKNDIVVYETTLTIPTYGYKKALEQTNPDDDSNYIELWGDISATFPDDAVVIACESISWVEYWYPVRDLGGISAANTSGALSLTVIDDTLHIGASVIQGYAKTHLLWQNQIPLLKWTVSLRPGQIFKTNLHVPEKMQ